MTIGSPVIPREHGGWAVVITPMIAVFAAVRGISWQAVLLTAAALSAYLSYDPLNRLLIGVEQRGLSAEKLHQAKAWASIYLMIAAALFLVLLREGYTLLVIFAAVAAGLFLVHFILTRKARGSLLRDLSGIAGLSMACPSMYYVLRGAVDRTAVILWLQVALFFAGTIFYVHMKIETLRLKRNDLSPGERLYLGRWTLLSLAVMIVGAVAMSSTSLMPAIGILAFVPITVHTLFGIGRLNARVNFRNLGLLLLGQSVVFGILIGVLI
ncbi:MAG TPA: YwiC-like family protein [Bacteroidota bacterium]|nr:YwiC-like family protein [Bacteroidota bacterium]